MKPRIFNRYLRFLMILIIIAGMSSCYKDRFDMNRLEQGGEWSPDMAAPFINSNLTLKDILNDYDHNNLIVEDGSGFLSLVYTNNIFSQKAEDIMVIPTQNINSSFSFSVIGALPFGTNLTAPPVSINYSFIMPNNAVIDELDAKGGMLKFSLNSPNLNHNATINVSIPSATLNGIPFNQNIDYIAGSTSSPQLSLNGYKILFDNTGGNQNRLAIIYTVTLHGSGGSNNSPYSLNLGESFNNIKFSKILGDFKQIPFNLPNDTIILRIFSKNIFGMIDFENPMASLYAYNSFGMPIRINFNSFIATSGWNAPYTVSLTGLPNPWDINASSTIGQIAQTDFQLTRTNSNIWDAIAISPQKFIADMSGMSNPGGGVSSNFALDTSRLKVDAQIEIPLFGRAWDFVLQDTIDQEIGQDVDKIEFILFRINTTNGFPVEALQQLYFVDGSDHIIDSLVSPELQTLSPAPTNGAPAYRVTQPVNMSADIRLENNRILPLKNCKKIIVRAKLITTQSQTEPVKFYSDYSLNVRVGIRTKFKVNY